MHMSGTLPDRLPIQAFEPQVQPCGGQTFVHCRGAATQWTQCRAHTRSRACCARVSRARAAIANPLLNLEQHVFSPAQERSGKQLPSLMPLSTRLAWPLNRQMATLTHVHQPRCTWASTGRGIGAVAHTHRPRCTWGNSGPQAWVLSTMPGMGLEHTANHTRHPGTPKAAISQSCAASVPDPCLACQPSSAAAATPRTALPRSGRRSIPAPSPQ